MPEMETPASGAKSQGLIEMAGGRPANEARGTGMGGVQRELRPEQSSQAVGIAGSGATMGLFAGGILVCPAWFVQGS